MDDIVVNYLPNAFAFIYVINSSLAGGVQKDRVSMCYSLLYLKANCQVFEDNKKVSISIFILVHVFSPQ